MLHLPFSKIKNPASGRVLLLMFRKVDDLHGNPARKMRPGSAQLAKTDDCAEGSHGSEFMGFLLPMQL
jgi:hypothetical protein